MAEDQNDGVGRADPVPMVDQEPEDRDQFFVMVGEAVSKLTAEPDVLLNIPIWGWQGSGKTCALLTAIHYCRVELHGISLARVKDRDELLELEERVPSYRGLRLSAVAEATSARLGELSEQFFVDLNWPPGTDTPMHYLLEMRASSGKLGVALFPDIMGGSYEKLGEPAKNALANAHAAILLVDPEKYCDPLPRAKEYRDDILGVIQRCARSRIAVCAMITKVDEYKDDERVDDTVTSLHALLAKQPEGFASKILRVSVIGDVEGNWKDRLPETQLRRPHELIYGWIWTLKQALTQPRANVINRVPRTNLKGSFSPVAQVGTKRIPEIRVVRDKSSSPGRVLCCVSEGEGNRFLLLDETGTHLTEVAIDATSDEAEIGGTVELRDWSDSDTGTVAYATDGAIALGVEKGERIWYGPKGQSLEPIDLPYPMVSWVPTGDRTIAGVDDRGTLHVLVLEAGKWRESDYRGEFVPASDCASTGFVKNEQLIIVHEGTTAAAIRISDQGRLGEMVEVALGVRFDADGKINDQGFLAAVTQASQLAMGRSKSLALGEVSHDAEPCFAVAQAADVVAWVSAQNRLHAATLVKDQAVATKPKFSPELEELPNGMCWNANGNLLFLTFPSGRWAWCRRFGF